MNDPTDSRCPKCEGYGRFAVRPCRQCNGWGCDKCHDDGYEYKTCKYCGGDKTLQAYEETQAKRYVADLLTKRYGTPEPSSIRDYWLK